MPHIKLVIHIRVDAFHIWLYAYMAISCHNLHFCPFTLDILHAPFKSFSLHGITAGHFADLNNLEVNYFVVVSDAIYCKRKQTFRDLMSNCVSVPSTCKIRKYFELHVAKINSDSYLLLCSVMQTVFRRQSRLLSWPMDKNCC